MGMNTHQIAHLNFSRVSKVPHYLLELWDHLTILCTHTHKYQESPGLLLSGVSCLELTAVGIRVKLLLCCLAEAVQLSGQQKSTDKHTHLHIRKSSQMHTDTHGNTKPIQRIQNKL